MAIMAGKNTIEKKIKKENISLESIQRNIMDYSGY